MAKLRQAAEGSHRTIALPSHVDLSDGSSVPLKICRRAGKNIRLSIQRGQVVVSVPGKNPLPFYAKVILSFLEENREWVSKEWKRQGGAGAGIRNGEEASVALRGHAVPLVWKEGKVSRAMVVGDDDEIHVWLPSNAVEGVGRNVVAQLLEAELRKDIALFLNRWLPSIQGGSVSRMSLRLTDGQWGSMNKSGRLAVCISLVGARPSALEYVIVHELCHQIHMDHTPRFWNEVRARFPTYQVETDYLKRVGPKLKTMWNRLEG